MIRFEFEGALYTAPLSFYETNELALPDGRVICATGWLESSPPVPQSLQVKELPKAKTLPTLTVQLVALARGHEWWVMVNGTCVVDLDLSPHATSAEAVMLAEQTLVAMVRSARVSR